MSIIRIPAIFSPDVAELFVSFAEWTFSVFIKCFRPRYEKIRN